MVRRIAGGIVFLLGVALTGWIGYSLFIEQLPDTQGLNPLPPIVMAGAFLYVGYKWLRGQIVVSFR